MHLHLFEFEDFEWLPAPIRDGGLDYLRYVLKATHFYDCVAPVINQALEQTGDSAIVDLCSGGGGSIEQVQQRASALAGREISVTLTDRFPNLPAYRWLQMQSEGRIGFRTFAIDAADVPRDLTGFRTMFSAIHHFSQDTIRDVLRNAVAGRSGIGIFDASEKGIRPILGIPFICVVHPIVFALCTPFFRPFRWSRLFFTYLVPLIPLYTIWDGCVSGLRLYRPEQLLAIAQSTDSPGYVWKAGMVRNQLGAHVAYLVGIPNPRVG